MFLSRDGCLPHCADVEAEAPRAEGPPSHLSRPVGQGGWGWGFSPGAGAPAAAKAEAGPHRGGRPREPGGAAEAAPQGTALRWPPSKPTSKARSPRIYVLAGRGARRALLASHKGRGAVSAEPPREPGRAQQSAPARPAGRAPTWLGTAAAFGQSHPPSNFVREPIGQLSSYRENWQVKRARDFLGALSWEMVLRAGFAFLQNGTPCKMPPPWELQEAVPALYHGVPPASGVV